MKAGQVLKTQDSAMEKGRLNENLPAHKGKIEYLNIVRIIALFLILYAHLVCVACFNPNIPAVFSSDALLPVINKATTNIWLFDTWMGNLFHTACGPIGVVLFLWLSGYLATISHPKYTAGEFIKRRIIRLWPGLIISLTLVTAVLTLINGLHVGLWQYLFNILLLHSFVRVPVISTVIWVLMVEMLCYFVLACVKEINIKSMIGINCITMLMLFFQINTGNTSLQVLNYFMRFVPLMLVGCAIQKYGLKSIKTLFMGVWAYSILYMSIVYIFKFDKLYRNIGTYLVPLFIWIVAYIICKKIHVTKFEIIDKIKNMLVNISYIVYLIHVPVGLTIMYHLRGLLPSLLNIFVSTGMVLCIAALLHYYVEKPISGYLNRKFLAKE